MAKTMVELAHEKVFPSNGRSGMTYGEWLVGQTLPKVVEEMGVRSGPRADPREIASRTMLIVNEMLNRMTSE